MLSEKPARKYVRWRVGCRIRTVAGRCSRRVRGSARAGVVVACLLAWAAACVVAQNATAQGNVATDRAALVALYEATDGADWRERTNWLSEAPIGDWYGVTTDESGRVSALELADNGLTGTLPPEVGNLSALGSIGLGGNALTGPIPRVFWSLPVELVDLAFNPVTGPLPPEVSEMADLSFLELGWTAMSGPLPQSMTNLSLDYLRIEGSYLCAPSNAEFQAWLKTVEEYHGETCGSETGSVETDRAALVALYNATGGPNWRNDTNWLSARSLGEWYGVTTDAAGRVVGLDLGFGGLIRELPAEIGNLSRLRNLDLYDNFDLTGPLPPEVGNLGRLEGLGLTSTAIYGPLPAAVCDLSNLWYLGLSWSNMRGPLPQCLTNLSALGSFNTWETYLCAPANPAFQTWLAGLSEMAGIETCEPSTFTVAPPELRLRGAVAQSIAVTQTGGGDLVSWTAAGTRPWLRVTPAAGMGTGRVTVSVDPVSLQSSGGSATAVVVVTADGVSARVSVTAVRAAAALPGAPVGPTAPDGLAVRGGAWSNPVPRVYLTARCCVFAAPPARCWTVIARRPGRDWQRTTRRPATAPPSPRSTTPPAATIGGAISTG